MNDFKNVYNQILTESKSMLEQKRKNIIIKSICISLVIIIFFIGIFSISKALFEEETVFEICGIYVVLIIVLISKYGKNFYQKEYSLYYKECVISRLVNLVDSTLKYIPNCGLDLRTYNHSRPAIVADKIRSEDMIIGNVGENNFKMSDVKAYRITRDGRGRKTENLVFDGSLACVYLSKNFNESIIITNKSSLNYEFDLKNVFKSDSEKKVELDSGNFEKKFDVYSTNREFAYSFLTADIMESILNFTSKSKIKLEIKINGKFIFIKFFTKDSFESNILKSSIDFDVLRKDYELISFMVGIISKINDICNKLDT